MAVEGVVLWRYVAEPEPVVVAVPAEEGAAIRYGSGDGCRQADCFFGGRARGASGILLE